MGAPGRTLDFDYIVIGAGSAGCVLANRLSANPSHRVCLVEGGVKDKSPRIHVPAGTLSLYVSQKYAHQYKSVPQKHLYGREIGSPRGRMLGGSSSMNSMIYIRGARSDYDHWAELGCRGWGYDDVLPFFMKSENNQIGQEPQYHGSFGELHVNEPRDVHPLSKTFVDAAVEAGESRNDDFNGATFGGVGVYALTQKDGKRLSSYRAFVAPVLEKRPNLTLLTEATVLQLDLEGAEVLGVTVESGGERLRLRAAKETVISAGAYGSPQLLLASGVGDADDLKAVGVEVRHHLPGVGRNLQDHLDGLVTVRSKSSATLGVSLRAAPRLSVSPFQYLFGKKGLWTTNYVESGGFASTKYSGGVPDLQFHFVPGYRSPRGKLVEWGHGFAVHTCVLRPRSTGWVKLSADGSKRNIDIDFNFLSDEQDGLTLVEGLKIARRIFAASPFKPLRGVEMAPGPKVRSDDELLDYVRRACATVFHPSGTCRMGVTDDCVVTPDLKVRGLGRLRVADASIMPTLVSGNTNAPSIMIGEKAAALMLA
ncbi:GMC family oxidoreductase [Hansschlegelia plantiphila]|uniref:Alcohol dehydrogenase n=1 Tax=Hansschlegelia plantiphila TaxID=374655 RepID=A0A9W6MWC9_9HYPH|nr:GMC family oxidoreductase N-terminal domain-containing protein [Hansschlegelia plantiphila]GLK68923.1 alcohol dehydrogenase [Hansschlegelia plantiphila]